MALGGAERVSFSTVESGVYRMQSILELQNLSPIQWISLNPVFECHEVWSIFLRQAMYY